jgi:LPXTG-motif cell wall-anchored protein
MFNITPEVNLTAEVPIKHESKTLNYRSDEYGKIIKYVEPIYNYYTYLTWNFGPNLNINFVPIDVKTGGSISSGYFIIIILLLLFVLYLSWRKFKNVNNVNKYDYNRNLIKV